MPCYEFQAKWAWAETASTGGSTQVATVLGHVEQFQFNFWTGAGCTCTVQMQAGPTVDGPWASLMTSEALSTSAYVVQQMAGPLQFLRPYVTAKTTGTLTIEVFGN